MLIYAVTTLYTIKINSCKSHKANTQIKTCKEVFFIHRIKIKNLLTLQKNKTASTHGAELTQMNNERRGALNNITCELETADLRTERTPSGTR